MDRLFGEQEPPTSAGAAEPAIAGPEGSRTAPGNTGAAVPLATRLRPTTLDELVGQEKLLAHGSALRRAIEEGRPHSMILHGPPGSGKTTLARLVATASDAAFEEESAVEAGRAEVRAVMERARERLRATGRRTVFFLDEIHRFNKAQQDALLPAVEDGLVTLIGATTENPFFSVNSALISRSRLYELEALGPEDVRVLLDRAPDYSAAYVVVNTDAGDGLTGHGFVFTVGEGNDIQTAAIRALAPLLVGKDAEVLLADMGATSRLLVHEPQLRWLGPEKGVMHMAIGAVLNALWDLKAKRAGLPLWQLLGTMSPEEIVNLVDFRYLTDALTPDEALAILRKAEAGREQRTADLLTNGYPGYTTTPGWLGYSDEKLVMLSKQAVADGFSQIKLKVGGDLDNDVHRMRLAREALGPGVRIAVDANQRWDVSDRDRGHARAGAERAVVDRGTDLAGRRARPRRDPAGDRADQGRHR